MRLQGSLIQQQHGVTTVQRLQRVQTSKESKTPNKSRKLPFLGFSSVRILICQGGVTFFWHFAAPWPKAAELGDLRTHFSNFFSRTEPTYGRDIPRKKRGDGRIVDRLNDTSTVDTMPPDVLRLHAPA